MDLSVVIPARNEAPNVAPLVAEIRAALDGRTDYEIVYVDDGSGDGTADAIRGQGVPVGWNPYVVAARFIVMKAEQMMDVQDVAREIAQQIWAHRAEVIAARQQAGGR